MTTAHRDRRADDGERERREANSAAQTPLDQPMPPVLALQQSAGNAAVSRLVARSRLLLRDDAPATSAPSGGAAPAAGGSNPVLDMAKVAWDTGVTQREQDAAKKLEQPQAGKPELTDAAQQLKEATAAVDSIGAQLGALDPARKTRADVHYNSVSGAENMVLVALTHSSPHELAQYISTTTVGSSQSAISDLTKPLSGAPGSSSGGSPSASNPGSASGGEAAAAGQSAAAAGESAAAGTN